MTHCQYCGEFVTDFYGHVFARPGRHGVRVCPNCEDELRDSEVTEAVQRIPRGE